MTSTHPKLQNWTEGTLKPIKLIGMNFRFTKIHKNSQKGTGTKMAEKLNNFERFDKENQISALFSTQRPLDYWPDVLDH